jgi:hypothetical protein
MPHIHLAGRSLYTPLEAYLAKLATTLPMHVLGALGFLLTAAGLQASGVDTRHRVLGRCPLRQPEHLQSCNLRTDSRHGCAQSLDGALPFAVGLGPCRPGLARCGRAAAGTVCGAGRLLGWAR